jgi:hypothetical protein
VCVTSSRGGHHLEQESTRIIWRGVYPLEGEVSSGVVENHLEGCVSSGRGGYLVRESIV